MAVVVVTQKEVTLDTGGPVKVTIRKPATTEVSAKMSMEAAWEGMNAASLDEVIAVCVKAKQILAAWTEPTP